MNDKIKLKGVFTVKSFNSDGKLVNEQSFTNTIMNEGVKKLIGILNGDIEDNIELEYIVLGVDDADITDKTRTDVINPATSRLISTSGSVGTTFPFELNKSFLITTGQILRPVTVKEFGIFFGPRENGIMFARAVIPAGIIFTAGETNLVTYGLYIT